MFTWVCPNCGGSVDVAADTCPHCSTPALESEDEAASLEPEAVAAPGAALAETIDASAGLEVETETPDEWDVGEEEPPTPADASPPPLAISPRQLGLFAVALVVAVLAAVWLAGGGGLPGLRLEDPPEAVEAPVEAFAIGVSGPVEVSAIRPYYDEDFQTHVRAFVANHSKEPQSVAFSVLLRVREAGRQAPPLATFEVVLPEPLPPNGGQEVDIPLAAMGSLQSMPPWERLRVDLEPL